MANPYFNNLPDFLYVNRTVDGRNNNDYSVVKNLFKRAKLRDDIYQNVTFFDKFIIDGDDRPDNVADKIYNDPTLDWVVLISNNILNVQSEWPMSQIDFNTYVTEKYENETVLYSGIHHYKSREVKTTDGSIIIPSGERVSIAQSVSYYDDASGQHVRETDIAIPVTNFEFENDLNNKKREIFVLKREYLNVIFDDLDEIMRYEKGSTQFLSRTLVRGDNIRLYQ